LHVSALVHIDHLANHPRHLSFVVELVYREFWADVDGGLTRDDLATAFGGKGRPGRVLASLIALEAHTRDHTPGHTCLGCVHLIDNDDESRPELHPWLAAMVVVADRRGQGIGSALVRALTREARAMGFEQVWLGTDGPGFYERLGALEHQRVREGFWIMRLPT
jgi:predicted N-acetyltransferase YhbS